VQYASDVEKLTVKDPDKLAYVTQTTLSVDDTKHIIDALKTRFPSIAGPELRDICYATQNRQNAVRKLAKHCDLILVIGSQNSSNSNRLRDLAEEMGVAAHLIPNAASIEKSWLDEVNAVGITAGASAPEHLVQEVVVRLQQLRLSRVRALEGITESTRFKLPVEVLEKNLRAS
jgi:4-hydroxy-3-methylbut-2-enyl diphosphate reductase